jgi:hypothetical protein
MLTHGRYVLALYGIAATVVLITSPDKWRSRPFDELPFAADSMWARTLLIGTWAKSSGHFPACIPEKARIKSLP